MSRMAVAALVAGLAGLAGPVAAQTAAPGATAETVGPAVVTVAPGTGAGTPEMAAALNDYPTVARADYVFVCMATNGETRPVLERCACAIDTIASILPYADYEAAEAILALQQVGGERASLFRDNAAVRGPVANLRRAQAEAEIVCFE